MYDTSLIAGGGVMAKKRKKEHSIYFHILLFLLTFLSVSVMGTLFVGHTASIPDQFNLFSAEGLLIYLDMMWVEGVLFAVLLLLFLGVHEFGHYFAARKHGIRVTLPYFIPMPLSPIGTLGAVIRIKERIYSTKRLFDIGASGPIAGFIVSIFLLIYGFSTLPGPEYMLNFGGHDNLHQYIEEHGQFPEEPLIEAHNQQEVMILGNTLLFSFISSFFDNVPPMWELYHYPFLFAGWLGLFFTALNLMPVGQLDGGHILYSLLGYDRHIIAARCFFVVVMILAGLGAVPLLQHLFSIYELPAIFLSWVIWAIISLVLFEKAFNSDIKWALGAWTTVLTSNVFLLYAFEPGLFSGFTVWIFWAFFLVYFAKIEHPPMGYEKKLSFSRILLGWLCMIIFVLCISPTPIYFISF